VAAPVEECFVLLAAIDRYPQWCPDVVRYVEVLERGTGRQPRRAQMLIHVARGTLVKEFQLLLAITVEPARSVTLRRVTDHPTNQEFIAVWLLHADSGTGLRFNATRSSVCPRLSRPPGSPTKSPVGSSQRRLAHSRPRHRPRQQR
jgi:hypothetical protein